MLNLYRVVDKDLNIHYFRVSDEGLAKAKACASTASLQTEMPVTIDEVMTDRNVTTEEACAAALCDNKVLWHFTTVVHVFEDGVERGD